MTYPAKDKQADNLPLTIEIKYQVMPPALFNAKASSNSNQQTYQKAYACFSGNTVTISLLSN